MLQIRYKGRTTRFHYDVKKSQIKEKVNEHLGIWRVEQIKDGKKLINREIPVSDVILEWQDGDEWVEDAPTETISLT